MFKNLLCSVHNAGYSIKTVSFSLMLLRKNKGEGCARVVVPVYAEVRACDDSRGIVSVVAGWSQRGRG